MPNVLRNLACFGDADNIARAGRRSAVGDQVALMCLELLRSSVNMEGDSRTQRAYLSEEFVIDLFRCTDFDCSHHLSGGHYNTAQSFPWGRHHV